MLGATWSSVLDQFEAPWRAGLTATMVAADYFCHCLAPLQDRPHTVWFYSGDNDASRLVCGAESNPDATMVVK